MSPPVDTVTGVLIPTLARFGVHFTVEVMKRSVSSDFSLFGSPSDAVRSGFYPKGQGVVHLSVQPVHSLRPINLVDRGEITEIRGVVFSHDLSADVRCFHGSFFSVLFLTLVVGCQAHDRQCTRRAQDRQASSASLRRYHHHCLLVVSGPAASVFLTRCCR
jgi:hypothetical protein